MGLLGLNLRMELEAWSGDWGLPSIDAECLKILAFAKFSGAPLTQVLLGCLLVFVHCS